MFLNNQNFENRSPASSPNIASEKIIDLKNPQIIYKIRLESAHKDSVLPLDLDQSDTHTASSEPHLELNSPPKLDKKKQKF